MEDTRNSDETGQLAEAEWLAHYIATDGGGHLINSIGDLVRSGRLEAGMRLPTVRALGACMGVSAATVAAAWSTLRQMGLIETRRRGGTVVIFNGADRDAAGERWSFGQPLDLAQGLIDRTLLPPLESAFAAAVKDRNLHGAAKDHCIARLKEAVEPEWPFRPQAWSTAGSGTEAALLAIEAASKVGLLAGAQAFAAVESPTNPRLLDILRTLGLPVLPVACDHLGPVPEALRAALAQRPAIFLYQPRAQVPLGHSVPPARISELAAELERSPQTIIVEDDFFGPLARTDSASLGSHLPARVIHVRTYCNTYGIDLRTSVLAGAAAVVDMARTLRSHGAAMTSRILQGALAHLLRDPATATQIATARETYASRRVALAEALRARGFEICNRDGLGIWLPVAQEERAIVTLAEQGISVGAGSRCYFNKDDNAASSHLRLATGRLPDDREQIAHIADALATAATT